jgi:phage N-6-adenine-methyltransferase
MGKFEGKFESAKQDWETPWELFNQLHAEFAFTIDVAASNDNAKCSRFLTKQDDAMLISWGMGERCWLNPPYGEVAGYSLERWVRRASSEAANGNLVVMLIPARTNTNWFHDVCLKAEVRFIRGRPKFGGAKHGLPQPLCLVVFDNLKGAHA